MNITVITAFGVSDIDTPEISPAVLEIAVEPGQGRDVEDKLIFHAVAGNFQYAAGPDLDRFRILLDQYTDLYHLREALLEIAELDPRRSVDTSTIWDLIEALQQQREETIARKDTDTIEDEIATGIYGDEFF
ncbi:MAG: WW domain binding protein 11 [Methanoculleus sp.]|jgi:hypothetical protein|nr:WW domain binding protein 11 [Methanoculleus sp.]PKL54934.1 MAG: hypothetical protein CVV35_12695 [Methanomicrobiales archaeon HGW-Methanomicrobiales-6]